MACVSCASKPSGSMPGTGNGWILKLATAKAAVRAWYSPLPKTRTDNYICAMPDILNCILIDDEPKAIAALSHEIQRVPAPRLQQLASFTRSQDALDYLNATSGAGVDVVFIDIEMPGLDGFGFVDAFPDRNFDVIFTTAHSHYAIEAIRKNAFDYLVKPVFQADLRLSVERLAAHRASAGNAKNQAQQLPDAAPFGDKNPRV